MSDSYVVNEKREFILDKVKDFIIKNGVSGVDSNNRLDIIIDNEKFPLNANYELTIARNSKGEIVQYCEADLIQ